MSNWRLHPFLPIFGVRCDSVSAVYVPGHVMPVSETMLAALEAVWFGKKLHNSHGNGAETAEELVRVAKAVQDAWVAHERKAFEPVCLNIQLPYVCNQRCAYCYSAPVSGRHRFNEATFRKAVRAAAQVVAANCAKRWLPLQVDFQGLGEPTARWEDLVWCVAVTQDVAACAQVSWSGHLSTNGQISSDQADWIGRTFCHVTVSCDGPPHVHDRLRPRTDGSLSSSGLSRSARSLASSVAALEARLTISDGNWMRLKEAVQYIDSVLGIRQIRLEPVFSPVPAGTMLPDPQRVARACLAACRYGAALGAEVSLASPSLARLHGEYCQTSRQTLRLMPDGRAVNCIHGACGDFARAITTGYYDPGTDVFVIAHDSSCQLDAGHLPVSCRSCINVYHCTRSCPDSCPAETADRPSWRCLFQQTLAEDWIAGSAAEAVLHASQDDGTETTAVEGRVRDELSQLDDPLACSSIVAETLKVANRYDLMHPSMPAPPWADEHACLKRADLPDILLRESLQCAGAFSVYVHFPFCQKRCVFCDCHSIVLGGGRDGSRQTTVYMDRLRQELTCWCDFGGANKRPVTTVHLGGGTPAVMGNKALSDWVATLRSRLSISSRTQWAIEATSSETDARQIDFLLGLGFRRLHVGVQTLHDNLRNRLGRMSCSDQVLARLAMAMGKGMVVSVDMIYGLPEQSVNDLCRDLERLVSAKVHGISLYKLNLSARNQGVATVFPGFIFNPLRACVMLQAADRLLLQAGYKKNHFVHYALPEDDNCYYRHAARGEDLLGLGASASGVIGQWEYRNAFYPNYLSAGDGRIPVFSLARNALSSEWRLLEASLLAGCVQPADSRRDLQMRGLLSGWREAGLLKEDGPLLRITATGAWVLDKMIGELREAAAKQ